jgi:hypothetical protein
MSVIQVYGTLEMKAVCSSETYLPTSPHGVTTQRTIDRKTAETTEIRQTSASQIIVSGCIYKSHSDHWSLCCEILLPSCRKSCFIVPSLVTVYRGTLQYKFTSLVIKYRGRNAKVHLLKPAVYTHTRNWWISEFK